MDDPAIQLGQAYCAEPGAQAAGAGPLPHGHYAANVGNEWHGVNEVIPVRGFNYNLGAWTLIEGSILISPSWVRK